MRGHNNNHPPIGIVINSSNIDDKLFIMDGNLFNMMENCQNG
jgi:hypothetical protein